MRHLRIIFRNFLTPDGENYVIGGIETYIKNIGIVGRKLNFVVEVYQISEREFCIEKEGILVHGYVFPNDKKVLKRLVSCAESESNLDNDILIFATDFDIVKSNFKHVLAIQHGVNWDITSQKEVSDIKNIISMFKGAFRAWTKYERFRNCHNIVCVDYNFQNWYRTQVEHVDNKLYIIPNFAHVPAFNKREDKKEISIIFARRFVEFRGTKLFAYAVEELLQKYDNLWITIAGEGPDEAWLKNRFEKNEKVIITRFTSEESIEIHQKHDIAVVPTLGSEGTSLSLLEAMSAGCAVVATNVGGMTNIVLDGYNGLLISPEQGELVDALSKLIENRDMRHRLAERAYVTVNESFSFAKWEKKWEKVLENV